MTPEEMDYWMEKQKALTESVELLAGSTRDLRAVVVAQLEREKLREEVSARYLGMLSDVLKAWSADSREGAK
jgi:hypothetical protein